MSCPLCGEVCRCPSEPFPAAPRRWKPDVASPRAAESWGNPVFERQFADLEAPDLSEQRFAASLEASMENPADSENTTSSLGGAATEVTDTLSSTPPDSSEIAESPASCVPDSTAGAWRDELSLRLDRYRSRRKAQPPRYPSLRLPFEPNVPRTGGNTPAADVPSAFESSSNHALALDLPDRPQLSSPDTCPDRHPEPDPNAAASRPEHSTAKIIEFPRFAWGPPAPPPDQLAEPVSDRPRILDVPEVAPPPPALGGITIEAAQHEEVAKRPGIDIPLQSASIARRIVASGIDGLIIALASAMFAAIFWKVAAVRPPIIQVLALTAAVPCLLWAAYHYLLLVYSGSTPGLRMAGLQLARFDGTVANRRLRRWRVLASYLSAASLGMGYAWLFLDEDALCWHDRITQTYLAPRRAKASQH